MRGRRGAGSRRAGPARPPRGDDADLRGAPRDHRPGVRGHRSGRRHRCARCTTRSPAPPTPAVRAALGAGRPRRRVRSPRCGPTASDLDTAGAGSGRARRSSTARTATWSQREAPGARAGHDRARRRPRGAGRRRRRWRRRSPTRPGRLAVFLHGLTETEDLVVLPAPSATTAARRQLRHPAARRPRADAGASSATTPGCTSPTTAGRSTRCWARWSRRGRCRCRTSSSIGHSMGGLVARSALHQAGGGTPGRRAPGRRSCATPSPSAPRTSGRRSSAGCTG